MCIKYAQLCLNRNSATDGGLFQIIYFDEIHNNFPNFITTPITKTEQEIGFVSPSYKCNVTNN